MFSASALYILAGLVILALICTLFPVAPTSRAALLLLCSAVACFFLPVYVGLMIATGTVSLVIVDAMLGHSRVSVRRSMPHQLARGVASPFRIVANAASSGTKIRQPQCADVELSNKEAADDLVGTVTAHRRGLHVLPPFATRTVGPFGLAVWHRPYNETHEIKVFPDLPAAHRLAHSIQKGLFATAGLKRRGPLGLGTNFESVREYFPEDDIRNVNWAATARTGHPMTNQYRVEQDRDVVVLLDTGRLMTAPLPLAPQVEQDAFSHDDDDASTENIATRLDIALDALCGLVSVADVMGDRSGVVAFNSSVRKHLRPRRAGARAVIRTVFDLEPIPVDSDFEAACQRVGKSKRAFILILTDFLDAQSSEPLIRALRIVVKKHRVVVAGIIDPDVTKILEDTDPQIETQRLQTGALEMQRAANDAVERIKNAGAEVVFCEHDDLMLECVKSYLGAKQRAAF